MLISNVVICYSDSFPPAGTHAPLARTPSAPAAPRRSRLSPPADLSPPLPMHELFKPNDLHWADIATNTGKPYEDYRACEPDHTLVYAIVTRLTGQLHKRQKIYMAEWSLLFEASLELS